MGHASRRRIMRRRAVLRPLRWFGLAAVIAVLASGTGLYLATDSEAFVVRTPSMGTAAPVGTFVLTQPTTVADLRVGDVVAFHPPSTPDETFTHRVVSVRGATVRTRGDVNGAADPWTLTDHDLVGRAVVLLPGVGWAVRALPYLVGGGALVWILTRLWVSPRRRGPARLFGFAVTLVVTVQVLQPFIGVSQLATAGDASGATRISAVSTGLLPVRLTPADGTGHAAPLDLASAGRTGTTELRGGTPGSQFQLDASLHLSDAQWAGAVLVCLSPLLWTLLVGFRAPRPVAV